MRWTIPNEPRHGLLPVVVHVPSPVLPAVSCQHNRNDVGPLPEATDNLLKIIEIKLNCRRAQVIKLDVGAKGALVHFLNDSFPDLEGLVAYVQRLKGTAKLRPDSKLVIARSWPDAASRINGALQLSRGLARILA